MNRIEAFLSLLNLNPKYKGYPYLKSALGIALTEEFSLLQLNTYIYEPVAQLYHTSPHNVERNIRTLLHAWWETDDHKILYTLTPHPIPARPTIGEFLDIFRWILRYCEEHPEILD